MEDNEKILLDCVLRILKNDETYISTDRGVFWIDGCTTQISEEEIVAIKDYFNKNGIKEFDK